MTLWLGTETVDAHVVHVTRGALKMTAICGYYPVGFVTTGMGPEDDLCEKCAKVLDDLPEELPEWAKKLMLGGEPQRPVEGGAEGGHNG